jgi:hypothetical protein
MAIITLQSSRTFVVRHQRPIATVPRPIAEVGRVELYCHTHRALAGLREFLGSPAILSLRGRHTKCAADERAAIALLSAFRQLAQIAVEGRARHKTPSLTVCLGYCESLRRRVAWASSVPIRLTNATLHRLYSTKQFLRSVLIVDELVFISSKKGRLALNFADRLLQYIEVRSNLVISCGISNRGCLAYHEPAAR